MRNTLGRIKTRIFGMAFIFIVLFTNVQCNKPENIFSANIHLKIDGRSNNRLSREIFDQPCRKKVDGLIPDYQQACRFFSLCQGGRVVAKFQCPNDTIFDDATDRCDSVSRTTCNLSKSENFVADDDCARKEDGVYTDYGSDCKNFYICEGGRKTTFSCPKDTVFDWRTNSCKPTDRVTCQKLNCTDRPDGYYVDHTDGCKRYYFCRNGAKAEFVCPPGKIYNEELRMCSYQKGTTCTGPEDFNCHGLPDGYYPQYQSNCRYFHLCINNGVRTYSCPGERVFSSVHLACDHPRKATCEKPMPSECANKPNGVYPRYDKRCQEFVVCRNGHVLHTGVCLLGMILNSVTGVCQPRNTVVCSPVKDPDCSGRSDGLYQDLTTECLAYYVCLGEKRIVTTFCPKGKKFDKATSTCLTSSLVSCRPRPSLEMELPTTPPVSHFCAERIGIFPSPNSNCKSYIICAHDNYEVVNCPMGTIYDSDVNKCVNVTKSSVCQVPKITGSFRCLSKDGIFVDHSMGCKRWYECRNGIAFAYECPDQKRFHPHSKSCEPSYKTLCPSHFRQGESNLEKRSDDFMTIEKLPDSHLDCTTRPNGVYSSETKCGMFHICAEGISYSFKCPSGLSFQESTVSCVQKDMNCFDDRSFGASNFFCANRPDGMYPDYESHCRRYFICEREEFRIVYCPDRYVFSIRTMVCEPEGTAACGLPASTSEGRVVFEDKPSRPIYASLTPSTAMLRTSTEVYTLQPEVNELQDTYDANSATSILPGFSGKPDVPFECPNGAETGFFPDYSSGCKKFHICFRSLVKTYSCPSVLLFNPYTRNCDVPELVLCQPPEIPPQGAFDCNEKPYGYYPDYKSGCRKYYGCLNKEILLYTCPSGRIFNQKSMSCDLEDSVTCIDAADEFPSTPTTALHSSTTIATKVKDQSQVSASSHVHGIPPRYLFTCSDKADGFYPDYARHCHVFYRCSKGKKISHYCKQNLLFNPKTGICDFEQNVVCAPPEETNIAGR